MNSELKEKYSVFFDSIECGNHMALGTCEDDRVSVRSMSVVKHGSCFYFQSDVNSRKAHSLRKNNRASLCFGNISMEGYVTEIGHPEEHGDVMKVYKKEFPSSYDNYSLLPCERLYSFSPSYVQIWKYLDNKPYMEIFDIENDIYSFKEYETER